jgi:hypothetical protein
MHEYEFEFEGVRYSVRGDDVPEIIVLPNYRVLRVMSAFETYPAQIDQVQVIQNVKVARVLPAASGGKRDS